MVEYRPEVSDIWQFLRRHFALVRRIALALGGALLAGGIAGCLSSQARDAVGTAAFGGAIIGFFAPGLSKDRDLSGQGPSDDAGAGL